MHRIVEQEVNRVIESKQTIDVDQEVVDGYSTSRAPETKFEYYNCRRCITHQPPNRYNLPLEDQHATPLTEESNRSGSDVLDSCALDLLFEKFRRAVSSSHFQTLFLALATDFSDTDTQNANELFYMDPSLLRVCIINRIACNWAMHCGLSPAKTYEMTIQRLSLIPRRMLKLFDLVSLSSSMFSQFPYITLQEIVDRSLIESHEEDQVTLRLKLPGSTEFTLWLEYFKTALLRGDVDTKIAMLSRVFFINHNAVTQPPFSQLPGIVCSILKTSKPSCPCCSLEDTCDEISQFVTFFICRFLLGHGMASPQNYLPITKLLDQNEVLRANTYIDINHFYDLAEEAPICHSMFSLIECDPLILFEDDIE